MAKCPVDDCPLYGKREVPFEGRLNAKIGLVGESPGNKEVVQGRPFYERADAGAKLRKMAALAGLDFDDIFLMNSARCRINKDEMSQKQIAGTLSSCRYKVAAAIHHLKPKVLVVTGGIALEQILKMKGIKKARGEWVWSAEFDAWVMPTYHPAYICRNQALEKLVVADLKQVRDFLKNGNKPPEMEKGLRYLEVQSIAQLLKAAETQEISLGIDSEAQGLDWMSPNFVCISYSISFREGTGVQVDLFEECPEQESEFTLEWLRAPAGKKQKVPTPVYVRRAPNFEAKLDELEALLAHDRIKKYMMNGNFEVHAFGWLFNRFRGHPPKIHRYVMDIQAAANVIDENVYKLPDLTIIQKTFTEFRGDYKSEFADKYDKADMLGTLTKYRSSFVNYAVADADVTRRAGLNMRSWFMEHPRQANYFGRFVMPTLHTLGEMEANGAMIDRDRLPIVTEEVYDLMMEAQSAAHACASQEVLAAHEKLGLNLTRDALVRDILFSDDGFGMEVLKKTKGKDPSIDKEVRMLLLDRPLRKKARNFIEHYNEYSEYHTMWSRYLKGFEKHIKCDGRVHTQFSLATTVTGRTSTSNPNMQNNPKRSKSSEKIRKLIVAPPGYLLMAADQGQSELRWAAHISGDPEMIRIFRSGTLDIHTETAKSLVEALGIKWDSLSDDDKKMYRRNAKAINFGLLYLMSLPGFVRYAKKEYGIDLSNRDAQIWIDLFFGKYRMLKPYHRRTIDLARRQGFIEHCLGRIRHLPELDAKDGGLRAEAERMAVNHPIQGPSSDTTLMAANEIRREDIDPREFRPILFVHDELIYEVREDLTQQYARLLKDKMEHPPLVRDFGIELKVPLVADVKIGRNLAEMEDLDLAA